VARDDHGKLGNPQLRKRGCEHKEEIIAAVMQYIESFVSNEAVRQTILAVLDTASEALCPVEVEPVQ